MKKIFLFSLFAIPYFNSFSQSTCSDAQSHIFYAFNNAKDGLESNNITDVKYYAKKTLESFKSVQQVLGNCQCENVENYTYESIQKLSKVPRTEKMSDAKYFVAKAKDYAQKIITALDYCTVSDNSFANVSTDELSDLEIEELKLKKQQEELLKQQVALKQKLNKQKEEELRIEKQQLIAKSNTALLKNINAYNEVLNVCQCTDKIMGNDLKKNEDLLMSKSVDEIRTYYISSIKDLTSNYMTILSSCDTEK